MSEEQKREATTPKLSRSFGSQTWWKKVQYLPFTSR